MVMSPMHILLIAMVISLAAAFGTPVLLYARKCPAARAFRRIAARLEGVPTKLKL